MGSANLRYTLTPHVGLKLGGLFYAPNQQDVLGELRNESVYFEYQAPVLDFEGLKAMHGLTSYQMRPHSVYLSMASPVEPSQAILERLRNECEITNTPYLAEHIGYLNPNPFGPSFGYLMAPPLNGATISHIAHNVRILREYAGVPIALENGVIYTRHPESTMTWPEFMGALSKKLPEDTGWLIDYAHLIVTNNNLNEGSITDWLNIYAQTERKIFELHLANVKFDSHGVCHDHHRGNLDKSLVKQALSSLYQFDLMPSSITIEREIDSLCESQMIGDDIRFIRNICSHLNTNDLQVTASTGDSIPSVEIKNQQERNGRLSMLVGRVKVQLDVLSNEELETLAKCFGFQNFRDLINEFWIDPFAKHFEKSLPYYSPDQWDGVDLLSPFYEFLRSHSVEACTANSILNKILFEIAVRQTAILAQMEPNRRPVSILCLKTSNESLGVGDYLLSVDADDNIVAEEINFELFNNNHAGHIACFSDVGGIQWPNLKKPLFVKVQSPSLKKVERTHTDLSPIARHKRIVG